MRPPHQIIRATAGTVVPLGPVSLACCAVMLVLASGCTGDGVSGAADPASDDLPAVTTPLVQCAGLDECACSQTPGCAPITTDCWCPPAQCGSTDACTCEGGQFLGCSPVGGGCHTSHCPLLAEPSAPDQRGCMTCVSPDTCDLALTKLAAACPTLTETDMQWMCDPDLSVCTTFCLGQIRSCAGAECALCMGCSCTDDTFDSCVDECLTSLAIHH